MPTKRPRINVTITPELATALQEFRRASGLSPSSLITEMLSESIPVVQAMTKAYRLAKSQPREAAKVMDDMLTRTHVGLVQLQLDVMKPRRRRVRRSTAA